jgi:hypothetical protein
MKVLCLLLGINLWILCVTAYSANGNPHRIQTPSFVESSLTAGKEGSGYGATVTPACVDASAMLMSYGVTRRNAISCAFCSSAPLASVLLLLVSRGEVAQAACLMGDTSPDCIGVYKLPMDDRALSFIDTPEKLLMNAPDLRWVPPVQYPKTYKSARDELNPLQQRCMGLNDIVLKGDLTKAGTELLGILPRLTVAGRVVVQTLVEAKSKNNGVNLSMKAYRAEVAHTELLNKLGQCDILIGQAISGQLGVMAPAQLHILSDLREANALFDEFLRSIPDDFEG